MILCSNPSAQILPPSNALCSRNVTALFICRTVKCMLCSFQTFPSLLTQSTLSESGWNWCQQYLRSSMLSF